MNELISVIVPIYNSEKWLNKCIDSLITQTYEPLDIILVNDGSTDRSGEICDRYAILDSRVRAIHKGNSGVADTRNVGIDNALGDWIVFVDSDDFLSSDILSLAYQATLEYKGQNQLYQWNVSLLRNQILKKEPPIYINNITKEDLFCSVISCYHRDFFLGYYVRAVWGKLLKKSIIREHNIKFSENLYIGEDAVFILEYLKYIDGVVVVNSYGYNYRITDDSAVQKYKADLLEQSFEQIENIENILKDFNFNNLKQIKSALSVFAWGIFNSLVDNSNTGVVQKKLDKKYLYRDSIVWFEKYFNEMMDSNIKIKEASKFIKIQYLLKAFVPPQYLGKLAYLYSKYKHFRQV